MIAGLAVSNIAWDAAHDDAVAAMLLEEGCDAIEIAPTKRWENPAEVSPEDARAYRREWTDRGLSIVAMQSLLFGRADLQLFGSDASRSALLDHLHTIIDLGADLGARALVFGSPKNRLRGELAPDAANEIAVAFLRSIGEHAASRGISFCLEPIPPRYGADFVTTPMEAAELARCTASPGIRVNADLGALVLAGEDPAAWIVSNADIIAHYHASERDFVEITPSIAHQRAATGLNAAGYSGWVSLEMSQQKLSGLESIRRAVRVATKAYQRGISASSS